MQFSSDGSTWSAKQDYVTSSSYTLASGNGTKTVYVRFSGTCIDPSQTFQDDIILDETAPKLSTPTVSAPAKGRRWPLTLGLKATDNASGVKTVEVRRSKYRLLVAAYKRKLRLRGSPQKLSVRVKDGAGNASPWKKVKVLRR